MISTLDIAWLAGIIEGEGSIVSITDGTKGGPKKYPRIVIEMTDKDIVNRVAKFFYAIVKCHSPRRASVSFTPTKSTYVAQVTGYKAAAWLMTLYKFFGERRRAKVKEILSVWRLY